MTTDAIVPDQRLQDFPRKRSNTHVDCDRKGMLQYLVEFLVTKT